MVASRSGLLVVLALTLAGCGGSLGEYRFENARVVAGDMLTRINPGDPFVPVAPFLIRIEFSSATDLASAARNGAYVYGDFCPFRDRDRLGLIGPYYKDRPPLIRDAADAATEGVTGTPAGRDPDNASTTLIIYPDRHPAKDPRTGRFVYTAYLFPYDNIQPAGHPYDLRTDPHDICLRIEEPAYGANPRSDIFTVPRAAIAGALRTAGPLPPPR